MIIKYRNNKQELITEMQATFEQRYQKVLVDPVTNLDTTVYHYLNGSLQSITYYIEDCEDETKKIGEIDPSTSLFNIIVRSTMNGQKVETVMDYGGRIMRFKTRLLYDRNDQLICQEVLDVHTNQPIAEETTKHLFNSAGQEILIAEYNSVGCLSVITYKPEGDSSWQDDWEYYDKHNITELEKKLFVNLEYYKNTEFEL